MVVGAPAHGRALALRSDGLDAATEYELRVRAVNAVGNGEWSNAVRATPSTAIVLPQGAVRLYVGEPDDNGSPITGYEVQWRSGSQPWAVSRQEQIAVTAPHWQRSGFFLGIEYQFRVRARNDVGLGDWGPTFVVLLPAPAPIEGPDIPGPPEPGPPVEGPPVEVEGEDVPERGPPVTVPGFPTEGLPVEGPPERFVRCHYWISSQPGSGGTIDIPITGTCPSTAFGAPLQASGKQHTREGRDVEGLPIPGSPTTVPGAFRPVEGPPIEVEGPNVPGLPEPGPPVEGPDLHYDPATGRFV